MSNSPDAQSPSVEVIRTEDTVTVVLSGEFDIVTRHLLDPLVAQVRGSSPARIVFDLTRVGFIDCATARLIADAGGTGAARNRPILVSPAPVVRRLLQVTGLDALCELRTER